MRPATVWLGLRQVTRTVAERPEACLLWFRQVTYAVAARPGHACRWRGSHLLHGLHGMRLRPRLTRHHTPTRTLTDHGTPRLWYWSPSRSLIPCLHLLHWMSAWSRYGHSHHLHGLLGWKMWCQGLTIGPRGGHRAPELLKSETLLLHLQLLLLLL